MRFDQTKHASFLGLEPMMSGGGFHVGSNGRRQFGEKKFRKEFEKLQKTLAKELTTKLSLDWFSKEIYLFALAKSKFISLTSP